MPYKKTIEKFDELRNKESEQLIVTVGANQNENVFNAALSSQFEEMINKAPLSEVNELGGLLAVYKARGTFESKYLTHLKQKYNIKAESKKLKDILDEDNKTAKAEISKRNAIIEAKYQEAMKNIYAEIDKFITETEQERQDLDVISEQVRYLNKSNIPKVKASHIGVNGYCDGWAEDVSSLNEEKLVLKVILAVNKKYSKGRETYDIINQRNR